MSGYEANFQAIRSAGSAADGNGKDVGELKKHAQDAQVPPLAWGLLGLPTLFPLYAAGLLTMQHRLSEAGKRITELSDNLKSNADEYENNEKKIVELLEQVRTQLGDAAEAPTLPGEVAV